MGWTESLGISKVGQTVLAKLMESQVWQQLTGSVWGGFRKGTMASAHPDTRHISSSLYATGDFQAGTPMLELRESESEQVCVWVLKGELLGIREVSPTVSISSGFCSQKLWILIFLALEPQDGWPCMGLGLLVPEIFLPNFYPPHMDVGPAHFTSVPILPFWMDVVSLIPYLSVFHSTHFLIILTYGYLIL